MNLINVFLESNLFGTTNENGKAKIDGVCGVGCEGGNGLDIGRGGRVGVFVELYGGFRSIDGLP
jgi:hypothetical protein